jgi:hypothetical protein
MMRDIVYHKRRNNMAGASICRVHRYAEPLKWANVPSTGGMRAGLSRLMGSGSV